MADDIQDAISTIKVALDKAQIALASANDRLNKINADARQAEADLAAKRQEHANEAGALEEKRVEADKAAEEAAKRIKLGNDQIAEVTRLKSGLDEREKKISQAEQAAQGRRQELVSSAAALKKREDAVAAKEAEVERRLAKMKEAMT